MHAMQRGKPCLAPRYMLPVLASEADANTFLIFWQRLSMNTLYFYCLSILSDRWRMFKLLLGEGRGMLRLKLF